ncbi:MAG: family 43 glycosylhydrolase [Bacteroidetes bacterium]|nr:family 43 glycosylhydrolase [Bacteroidota bacterium]
MKKQGICLVLAFLFVKAAAQNPAQTTFCNPIDLDYRYNFEQLNENISYRSAADPVIVPHKGEYYLFATISGGYWRSKNLIDWQFITPSMWPMEDICAPAALSVRDTMFLFQSTFELRPIFYSTKPETGKLEFFNRLMPRLPGGLGPWDPTIFYDEDLDRWYMYYGSSNVFPIYGIELDKNKRLTYVGTSKEMFFLHPKEHGWERFGPNHDDRIGPFMEGAWMNKHNGKYYLQYGAPGTEFNVYANGVYVADNPLGPFQYAPYNPFAYKPGGFMVGCGHGNTFQDNYGNYWNTGTPWVAVNWNFERRMNMFPAGFDADGQLFASGRFGDFPHYLPTKKWQSPDELFTGWMLLSYKKPCTASSERNEFVANHLTDENVRSFWVAGTNQPGQWATIDLEKEQEVRALQINYTDYQSDIFKNDSTVYLQFRFYHSKDGQHWELLADWSKEKRNRPNAYIELPKAVRTRYIRFENVHVPTPNLAVSDIRIFGKGFGQPPSSPQNLRVKRHTDERDATLTWDAVPGAVGYNIRWGIGPEKLYQCYQIWADQPTTLELRALNVGVGYWFAVEAFNENGVSKLGEVVQDKK